jgi:hypothetical protein
VITFRVEKVVLRKIKEVAPIPWATLTDPHSQSRAASDGRRPNSVVHLFAD